MNEKITDYAALITKASDFLKTKLGYRLSTIRKHCDRWRTIKKFMDSRGIKTYSQQVEKQVVYHWFRNRDFKQLTRYEKDFHNSIRTLTQFALTGEVTAYPGIDRRRFDFNGPIGMEMLRFIEHKKAEDRLSNVRVRCYELNLHRFLQFCGRKQVRSIKKIDLPFIIHFIRELDYKKGTPVNTIISTVRNFIKYLYVEKILAVDYSKRMPHAKVVSQPKLPSTYTKTEIQKLIRSVERSSASGKRNYAIIVIAARLGLRASDIARLKFDCLKWESNTIELTMVKTGRELVLPLLPDVGNAIIDYVKYARPQSKEPYVFLTERPPHGSFSSSNVVTHIVQRAFKKAHIDITNRKFGPHSLRHSLGFRMLEQSTILPVMSDVFGHESTESTRYYLRIDLNSMKQCMLEVPPVTDSFYTQKGGLFYA